MVHSDFHYAKAMLFSALKLWYYISLSLYHFQRLPFLLIKLNRMLKISELVFELAWPCSSDLISTPTHICSDFLIWLSPVAAQLWASGCLWLFMLPICLTCQTRESFSLSGSPLQLVSPSQLAGRRRCHPPFPPPQGCTVMPHCTALVGLPWLSFYDFTRPGGFSFLHQVSRDPSPAWRVYTQPLGHDALPSVSSSNTAAMLPCQTLHHRLLAPAPFIQMISTSSLP